MTDDLFFIPILAKALRSKDRPKALQEAFAHIQGQGKQSRYRQGLIQFEQLIQAVRDQGQIVLVVEREGDKFGSICIDPSGEIGRLPGIIPGSYTICLSTGRLLWKGELGEADLVWAKAFPGRPLALAADTKGGHQLPSRKEPLGGGLTLLVFPGVEAGEISVVIDEKVSANDG
jgi:hypothetical protein